MIKRTADILSYLAIIVLCIAPFFAMLFEQERAEAISGGLIIGSVIGSVLGVTALLFNKGRSRKVVALSLIPICVIALFLVLAIPYYLFT